MTGLRLLTPRWLAAGGAVVLAAAIGATLLLQNGGAACAAPPSTAVKPGKATFYDLGGGGTGNCSFPTVPADDLYVALGPDQYSGSAACGSYLDVTGPKGEVRVKVTDSCPECAPGHLDLSRTAFKKIADPVAGIVPITYKTVRKPAVPGPLSVTIKTGSSQYWLAALIDNHGSQLTSVTIAGRPAKRAVFNFWLVDSGAGKGPFKIKLTDVYGSTTTLTGIKLAPGRTQRTTARLGPGTRAAAQLPPPTSPTPIRKKPAAQPVTSAKSAASSSVAQPADSATTEAAAGPGTEIGTGTTETVGALGAGTRTVAGDEATETGGPTEQPVDLAAAKPACG